jgi:hypothetical protein
MLLEGKLCLSQIADCTEKREDIDSTLSGSIGLVAVASLSTMIGFAFPLPVKGEKGSFSRRGAVLFADVDSKPSL